MVVLDTKIARGYKFTMDISLISLVLLAFKFNKNLVL